MTALRRTRENAAAMARTARTMDLLLARVNVAGGALSRESAVVGAAPLFASPVRLYPAIGHARAMGAVG